MGTSRIAKKSSALARRARYAASHWGRLGQGKDVSLDCADPREGGTVLGELIAVTYRTAKGTDSAALPPDYTHRFASPRPVLAFTKFGRHSLFIAGGGYRVEARGIVR